MKDEGLGMNREEALVHPSSFIIHPFRGEVARLPKGCPLMRTLWSRDVTALALLAVALGGAGTEARGEHNRRTEVVEAVEKTRAGIVSLKVEKRSNWGRTETVGTGIIVDERGYVVTNAHVIKSAERVTVRLADGAEVTARVITEDAHYDLAVVRIQAPHPLQALPLGPGSDLLVGEDVIAIGHPFGYTNTVSKGIISAVGRDVSVGGAEPLRNLIQVNASINPGNSGGPLLNINGEVIGINVALREDAQGIAFALNADTVIQVLGKQLGALKLSGVRHGLVCGETVSPTGDARQRVVLDEVHADTPAAVAGLKRGDLVLRVGDRAVSNRFDVERAFWERKPGDKVELAVVRDRKELALMLTLTQGGEADPAVAAQTTPGRNAGTAARAAASDVPRKAD
jgi:serine protease Do